MQNVPDSFLEECDASPNPMLFYVKPEGGQDSPEGLISWLISTAHAHSVNPRLLVRHMFRTSEAHSDVWSGSTFFDRDCVTINGLGQYAELAIELFKNRTAVPIKDLTLLPLKQLFPHNGEGALGRTLKWCSVCLCEQVRSHRRPHFKLAWSFEHYRVCPVHLHPLSERCLSCGCLQPFVPVYPSLLHCNTCGESLIVKVPAGEAVEPSEFTPYELWCAQTLDDLIKRRSELQTKGSLTVFRHNIEEIVAKLSPGNKKRLCESVGLQAYALNGWLNKEERPSMSVLLRLCYGISVEVAAMFLPDVATFAAKPRGCDPALTNRGERPLLGFRRREELRKLLEVIIEDATDRRPLVKVAAQLGVSRSALKYWFRQECRRIVLKNRRAEAFRLGNRYRKDHDLLRTIVQVLKAQDLYPGRRKVDAQLRRNGLSLMRPDIFQEYLRLRD